MTGRRIGIAVITLVAAAGAQDQIAGFQIDGTVLDVCSGRAMSRVRVSLAPFEHPESEMSVITREDGQFLFENLAAGKYRLTAQRSGAPRQVYGQWL